jgi:N-acetylneuraminic acid mutarotase
MEKRTRPRPDATQVALFLAMCAVLTIAGCVLVQGIVTGTVPGAGATATPGPGRTQGAPMGGRAPGVAVRLVSGDEAVLEGAWRPGPSLPTERSEVAAAVAGGTVYVLGGLAPDGKSLATVEALPPDGPAWAARAPLPQPRDHLAAVELGGQLYAVAGSPGWFGQQTSTTLWRYDAGRDAWEERAPLPLGRAAHAAAVVGGKLYVAGGIGPEPQRLLEYDPELDSWTTRAPLSRPREHVAAAAAGGKLYLVGGRWGDVGNLDLAEEYDPASDTWRALPALPTARGGLAATALGGRIFVTGGEALDQSRATFPQVEVFDPSAGAWLTGPPLPTGRHGLAAVMRDGEVYVLAGGRQAGLATSGLMDVFSPQSPQAGLRS